MMRCNVGIRREARFDGPTFDPSRERFCPVQSAEGATAPETLRQKDRDEDELLESGAVHPFGKAAPTEGVIPRLKASGEISQVP
jgi:hypothetical protein